MCIGQIHNSGIRILVTPKCESVHQDGEISTGGRAALDLLCRRDQQRCLLTASIGHAGVDSNQRAMLAS